MVVYLDAIWLLNLLIDACLLRLTALMLKRRLRRLRLWFGALFASLTVILMFTPLAFLIEQPAGKFIFSVLIIFMAFGYRQFNIFVQNLAAFYFSAFALGGGLFAVHYFFQGAPFYAHNHFLMTMNYGDPISWLTVAVGFPLLFYFSKRHLATLAIRKWQSAQGAAVQIVIGSCRLEARALIDSGNRLRDPLTRAPVIFVSRSACGTSVPEAFFSATADGADAVPEVWQSRLNLVAYRTVDGVSRFILAVRPDTVCIQHEGVDYRCRKALVAFTNHELSAAGDYNCLLHPDLLQQAEAVSIVPDTGVHVPT
ncbi:MAG: sigma-E processing peptidase SpoIIGA [Sporolactobacillus sp.]